MSHCFVLFCLLFFFYLFCFVHFKRDMMIDTNNSSRAVLIIIIEVIEWTGAIRDVHRLLTALPTLQHVS